MGRAERAQAGDGTELARAHATLARGVDFFILYADHRMGGGVGTPPHARVLGNRLRELDRFLNILADEAALCLGQRQSEVRAFTRLRNTPNKLRLVRAMMGIDGAEHARHRAIGRISACLHHCGGRIHAISLLDDIVAAAGAPESEDRCASLPPDRAVLRIAPWILVSIAEFYREIGDQLVDQVRSRPCSLTFRPEPSM
ncbi:MAG TPA: hypothetical protein VNZ43_16250 [Sphingomonadaceae bacterium]|nr:hypothetical protein [Sphingomonadaceae bacterium]